MAETVDYGYMAEALLLAKRGYYSCDPNPRVGCVLVRDQQVVGRGWHVKVGHAHAEINALQDAGERAYGSTAYITLEPCCFHGRTPPCTDALLAAGVKRVVAAMQDPHPRVGGKGFAQLRAAGLAFEVGVMEAQARALNPGFIQRMETGRPWVRCKLAMSLDARTAMASGESQWITGAAARRDVQRLRASSSAIMTGVATILADDPALNVRAPQLSQRQPLRVILDSQLRTSVSAKTLHLPGRCLLFTTESGLPQATAIQSTGAAVCIVPVAQGQQRGVDLKAVLMELARREINEVHLECGPTLAGAFLQAACVDELVIYMAPVLMGSNARGLLQLPLHNMAERVAMEITDMRAVGADWRIVARPHYTEV